VGSYLVSDCGTAPRVLLSIACLASVWDAWALKRLCELVPHPSPVRHACFSRSRSLVCTLCDRDALRLSDAHSGELLQLVDHQGAQFHLCVGLSDDTNMESTRDGADEIWVLGLGLLRGAAEVFAQRVSPLPAIGASKSRI